MEPNTTQATAAAAPPIPEGYRKNSQGHLVPVDMIKPVDALRDDLVMRLVGQAQTLNDGLVKFKDTSFQEVEAFIQQSATEYNANIGGKKGNATLYSFDGRFKVERQVQDRKAVDERIMAAKVLMDECAAEWSENAGPEAKALINFAFQTNSNGDLVLSRLRDLKKLEFTDERWIEAMKAIDDSLHAISTKSYIRVYQRVGDSDKFEAINLNISSI